MDKLEKLLRVVRLSCHFDLPHHSRVHPLLTFNRPGITAFVKREDEIGSFGGGSKSRKYLSLLPYLLEKKYEEAVLIGSPFSNHILCFSQLLIQNQIKPILFLYKTHTKKQGNFLWTSLLVRKENIHWVEKDNFDIEIETYRKQSNKKIAVISEGGSMKESLPGSLTLPLDILKNEKDKKLTFDHIIIDSGTGFIASSLILAFSYLEKKTGLHIVQMAGSSEEFQTRLQEYKTNFESLMGIEALPSLFYKLYSAKPNRSFGSHSTSLFTSMVNEARNEGLLTDPVFSGKLFHTARSVMEEENLKGNVLLIHSGGYSALSGYQDLFTKLA